MDNHFTIENIDRTIYVTTSVKPKFYAYFLLFIVIGVLLIPLIFVGFTTPDSMMLSSTFIVLWILFPTKYAWWNVFGTEILIINDKSISYQYDFGLIQSQLISKPYKDLTINLENLIINDNNYFGKIYFFEEDELTGLKKVLHQTSIYISNEQFSYLTDEIAKSQISPEYFSLN